MVVHEYSIDTIKEILKNYKTKDQLSFKCFICSEIFQRTKERLAQDVSKKQDFIVCSRECQYKTKTFFSKQIDLECSNCGLCFAKKPSAYKKSRNHFCSQSCSATYNNKNKTHGSRRSKLEIHLEEQIRINYPDIKMICNQKDVINSELDFYFPELKLAVELNGIFHYEPIYGEEKLSQIQNNDNRKFQACLERGIELCIIDSSKCKYLKQSAKDEFYNIFKSLLDLKLVPAEGIEPTKSLDVPL